jgi:hypothetical protein
MRLTSGNQTQAQDNARLYVDEFTVEKRLRVDISRS